MKLWKKALSLALCLCLVLSLMPALAPVEAEAASVPTYISGIYFAADKNQSTAKNAVKNAGYTLIDYDLNKGCGATSKYIYMGYKTTSDPSQAITGIFFSDDIKNPAASYTFPYNGYQITANKVSDVDLNSGASGDYIFAYTTTDLNFGNPVTTIQIKGNNSINAAEADGTWTIGRQIASGALYGTDGRNLNAATVGDKIYLHYKQAKALEAKAYFYQIGAQDAVSTVCTSYSGTVYDNYNTIEAKPQILQEASLGGVTYRFAGWREDTNGYVVTTTKPQMGADKVRYYYAIYDFDITVTFDSDGGNGAPDSFTVTSRAGAWEGPIPPGSTLPFFPISQEGVTVTLPTTVPTKEGTCGFSRWVRVCDGTTVEPGGKILMTFARYYSQMRAEYLSHGDSNGDGFCDRCDTSLDQPSVSNGAYQISTKAQLAWFMQKVNKGETSANAVLVNDIDMGGYEWTPITSTGLYYKTEGSDKGYAGTFDGAGYTISNFKITASTTEEKTYGLFGTLSGTVKNLGIRNVTYNFPNGIKDLRAAGIVGQMLPGSTVTDCFVVDSSIAPGKYIVGGVAACNYGGTIANCYTKNVTVKGDDRCGDLVSDTRGDNGETDRCGTVINCYTDASRVTGTQTGNLTSNCEAGVTADRFASGEIAYRLGQAWGQTLGKDALPTPGKAQVYYGYTTCSKTQPQAIYTNQQTTAEKPGHRFNADHICTGCELVCTHTEFAGGTCLCGKITGGYCGAEEDGQNLTWTLVDGVLTISGTGASAEYTVYTDVPWQQYSGSIKSVVIEEGVTGTANYAFALCEQLTQVQLPSSMETLGVSTFYSCNQLESVIIPQKVTVIPEYAFSMCENLKSITFEGKITTIRAYAFQECAALTKITLPDTVVSIGIQAFRGVSRLEEIVIPDSTTSIGEMAFRGCFALKTVTIGNGVTQIGKNAFKNCETLKTLTWLAEGDVALGTDVFVNGTDVFANTNTANIDLLLTWHHADEITDLVNWNGYTFKSIRVLCADGTLNHTTDYTGNNDLSHHIACSTCGYVGDEVHAYGENGTCDICSYTCTHTTFAGGTCICGKITGGYCGADEDGKNLIWTLVDGLLTISGEGAMKDYDVNTDPAPWYEIREQIQSIVIEDGVTYLGVLAFPLCNNLKEVQLADSVENLGKSVFNECKKLESIIIPHKVTVIPDFAFYTCVSLKNISFEGEITAIGANAFRACTALTGITLPDSVVSIGDKAFRQTLALKEIVIPDSVTTIGSGAFYGCSALENVTIGKNLTQMGDQVFYGCTALDTLTWLAEGDVALGVDVFSGTNTTNIDLLLTYHHADEITDLVNWNGYTFKSIRVLCADGTLNHTTDYTGNNDLIHHIACSTCGYVGEEVHAYGENGTCGICSYTCTHTTFAGGTCICGKITGGYCGAEGDGKNLTWTLVDGVLTISGEGAMKDYDVNTDPAPWYEIREQIQSIVIEDGVTTIGTHAFTYCTAVTEVEIPDSVMSIADGAFGRCELLEQITLPEKVTVISDRVFLGCENLNKVTFKGNITRIGERAFEKCIQLRDISLPDTLESIGERAFFQCKLAEIIIPDNVETIAYAMFAGCSELKRVTIGKGIAQIEAQAFVQCNALEELIWLAEGDVIIGTDVFVDTENNSYTANIDLLLTYHHAEEITDLVNWKGFTFKSIRVLCADGTLNHTADYTANTDGTHGINCTTCGYVGNEVHMLQYAQDTFAHSITCTLCAVPAVEESHTFGDDTTCDLCGFVCTHTEFANGTCLCGKITGGYCGAEGDGKNLTWTLVDGVLTISGEGAMKDYAVKTDPAPWYESREQIRSVVIEDGVTYLGIMAFAKCTSLTEAQISDTVESMGYSVFNNCEKLESIIIPKKVTVIPHYAFNNCSGLKSVTFEGKITTIEQRAFQACTSLSSITLPDSVVSIGDEAFRQTLALKEIVIPDSVTTIGSGAFYGCSALENVTIGKNLTQMGDQVFYGCTALDTLTWLVEGVVVLGADVFSGTTNTTNIDLLLTYHHADEITDLVNWNGFTFKSIRVLCADGMVNHTFGYTPKDNATHEMTCTLCGYAATEACSGGEGTATCINGKVCDLCQAPYGELNPNNHAAETYTNGFLDCCGKVYEPATGSGTESDPYKIGNAGQLYWFAQQVNGGNTAIHGKLVKNILINENVLAQDGTLNEGQFRVWIPMGNNGNRYTGTFDGNGKTISGLYFNDSAADYAGLFGYVDDGGAVKNVGIPDSYVSGRSKVGGVVGRNDGTVTSCYNTGSVSGGSGVGGVVGYNTYGTVTDCDNSGSVTGAGDYVGGVVGYNAHGTVTDCYNTGSVSGSIAVGGVVGCNDYGTVTTNSYNTGRVSGNSDVGGVVGLHAGTVTNSYNTGSVTGAGSYVGGVVGQLSSGAVTNSYNTGRVTGAGDYVGGVVGQLNRGAVTNCYYLEGTAAGGIDGEDAAGQAEAKTAEQFASGEVAYLLSQGCTVGEGEDAVTYPGDIWGQNIDGEGEKDANPVFSDAKVYQILNCNNEPAGYSNTDSDALGHDWTDADCDTPKTCKICGTTEGEALGHDWTDADCDTPKTCNRCGETEGEALGHSWNDATCDLPKTCSACGETEGEPLGHKLVDRICTVCNKMPLRIEMTNIDATGWNGNAIRVCEDGQLIATVTLAEDKTGDIWYYLGDPNKTYEFYWVKGDYCGGCGFAITIGDETVMIAFADENMEYADGIRIYPACEEHDYRFVEVHEPTCDLVGYTLYVCAVCGESMEDDYVPSLGHTIAEDAVGVVTPPTCENDGYTTYECDYCGESFDTLYLPALPHALGEDGLCSVCGQPYTVPVWVAGIQIDANNLTDVLGDGTVSYDPSANVLTLNGFAYEGTDAGIYTTMSVNIVLLGENTIHTGYYGILSEVAEGELTIRGTGTLTINSDTVGIEMYHYGQASMVIGGSVTVSAYAENAEGIACYSETGEASVVLQDHAKVILGTQEAPLGEECVFVDGFDCCSFTIEDNASISCVNTDEEGIYVGGDQQFIVISDNASVNICADEEALDANTIRISGGTVTVSGGEGHEGIYADELIITGGTITVSTAEVEDRAGDGVEADCITITGGTLKILSGGLMASMNGGETNVPGTITLGEGVVIASPAGAVLGQFDLTDIGEGMVLAVLDAEGNFADSLIIQFCVHEWADADCDTPKTCEICGVTEGEALGHSFENGSCSVCGEPDPDYVDNKPVITLKYPTLSFKDEVLINIYFDVSNLDNVEEMGLILYDTQVETWNIHNARKVISGYRYSQSNGLYAVTTDGIPAKNLTDTVWFAIYAKLADGSYTYTKLAAYSPKMYADSLLGTGDAKLDGLLVSMLNYGAAAQLYFGYKTDDLVNKDLTAEQKALVSGYRSDMVTTSVSVPAEKQGGFLKNVTKIECCPSVSFKGAFAINYYYKPETAPADGITLYYWDEAAYASNEVLTAQNAVGTVEMTLTADGKYTASVKGIPARKVNAVVYVALSYSDGTTTYNSGILPYSIGEYCSSFANTDHEFAPMAEATAVYGYYAKQYFG